MASNKNDTSSTLDRRTFLRGCAVAGAMAAAPGLVGGFTSRPAQAAENLDFATALDAAAAIRSKQISSVEMTQNILARIERHNSKINSVVTLIADDALARAKEADAALAKGENLGVFHGVPITIKDTLETKGVRTTAGVPFLSSHIPENDAVAVERIKRAGAVIIGKTNTPFMAGDVQTYNDVFGTTNNPWDVTRTCGGSTGGGAASLAAGLTYLSIGSDIGGSIRTPANFCGVFGHKPTLDLVPERGHIPPMPNTPSVSTNLAVVGPLARSTKDLEAALRVIGGPADEYATGYRWEMPAPRQKNLKDYRIGYMIDDPFCPVVPETKAIMLDTIGALRKAGANLTEGWPERLNPKRLLDNYLYLLSSVIDVVTTKEQIARIEELAAGGDRVAKIRAKVLNDPIRRYAAQRTAQAGFRQLWQGYFQNFDVFLMPNTFTPAFPHDHSEFETRRLQTSLGERHYGDLFSWISFATLTGCPSTVLPAGRTKEGLPVGMQVMGPFLEDATTIDVAGKIAEVTEGYAVPPGYEA